MSSARGGPRAGTADDGLRTPPDQPVLLAGDSSVWAATGVDAWLRDNAWSATRALEASRAKWLSAIQKVALVLITGDDAAVWELVHAVRPVTTAPLVVVARPEPDGVVALVEAGVDAVVDPEVGADELFARVIALLRRSELGLGPGVRYLQAGPLVVDLRAQRAEHAGTALPLSPTEYALLTFLMTHTHQALATQTIVRRVWGGFPSDGRNTLRICVNRLRRKLGDDPRDPRYIASVRGTGYRFVHTVNHMVDEPDAAAHPDVAPLLDSIESLAVGLQEATDLQMAADSFLDALDGTGYADGLALFQVVGSSMRLVSSRNMPGPWLERVAAGVPLESSYASAHTVLHREAVQFGDIRSATGRFGATADNLSADGYRACLFLPIVDRNGVWGHLGLARRSSQPFDPTGTAYLRAAGAVFALAMGDTTEGHGGHGDVER